MKQYETWILNALLDKYENSSLYLGKNQISVSIGIPFTKKIIPEYFDETSDVYEVIHDKMKDLELEGLIRIAWKNKKVGHIIDKVVLNENAVSLVYKKLNRKTKEEKELYIKGILLKEENQRNEVLRQFTQWVLQRMEMGETIKRYVDMDHPKELERILKAVGCVMENEEEIFIREFSILHFQDSKQFESIAGIVTDLIQEFSGDTLKELTKEQILEEYNIYHNPSVIMMKGAGIIQIGENKICLDNFIGGIGVYSQDLAQMQIEKCDCVKKILTIENLTVFHRWKEQDTLMIYLAGYHNQAKRVFLQKLHETYPDVLYYHFGDIDCGGFRIWNDLCKKTKIPFQPYYMDKKTMEKNCYYGKTLTQTDIKELNKLLGLKEYEEHWEVISYMLETKMKLEQECVYRKINP